MGLWVPPTVDRELQGRTRQFEAEVRSRARQHEIVNDFNRDLKAMDPRLEMVWFDDSVDLPGVVPGRYHLLRVETGVPPTIIPICGPNGEYIEPNSGLFEWLRKQDMWNAEANRDRERAKQEAERTAERRREQEREERLEELRDRFNANFRTSVSLNRDAAWSQNARGRRGAKT